MIKQSLCAVLLLLGTIAQAQAQERALFNGRDFAGWELRTEQPAVLTDVVAMLPGGAIAVSGRPAGFIATTASYGNYRLHMEWRWPGKTGNAGVLLHISPGPMDRVWPLSLQVQTKHGSVGDLLPMAGAQFAEPPTTGAGAKPIIKARLARDSERPAGEWNSVDILARNGTVEVAVNGVPQNRITQAEPRQGRIGFQLEEAAYELRNARIEQLD
jgi:hypothetical protein